MSSAAIAATDDPLNGSEAWSQQQEHQQQNLYEEQNATMQQQEQLAEDPSPSGQKQLEQRPTVVEGSTDAAGAPSHEKFWAWQENYILQLTLAASERDASQFESMHGTSSAGSSNSSAAAGPAAIHSSIHCRDSQSSIRNNAKDS